MNWEYKEVEEKNRKTWGRWLFLFLPSWSLYGINEKETLVREKEGVKIELLKMRKRREVEDWRGRERKNGKEMEIKNIKEVKEKEGIERKRRRVFLFLFT